MSFMALKLQEYFLTLISRLLQGLLNSVNLEFYGYFVLPPMTTLILLLQFMFSFPSLYFS